MKAFTFINQSASDKNLLPKLVGMHFFSRINRFNILQSKNSQIKTKMSKKTFKL